MPAAIHLSGARTAATPAGLAVGFACTLVLVFMRRLPGWVTGERSPRPRVTATDPGTVFAGLPDSDLSAPGALGSGARGRARLRFRTAVVVMVSALGLGLEIVAGGVLRWALPVPALVALLCGLASGSGTLRRTWPLNS
ncbi:hypothetical protein [Amycolatopsis sp.]|uniref:hypothetical protein n=1 Tax=Amycolatopsis sp. TaxID=37632 RepID=UPI002BF014B9|nr:hypothetical protein [Amycolatopsis sp.]HVV12579.1 hypothetical protein [Amycolatopsis sp.]